MSKTALFQAIQLSKSTQVQFQNSSLSQTIQSSISTQFSSIWPIDIPNQMLPLWARVVLRAMAMNGYSKFPKTPALLDPYD